MTLLLAYMVLFAAVGVLMMGAAIIGQPRTFEHRYSFVVEIDGFAWAGFRDCSGLKMNVGVVEHWEGGALTSYNEAGRVTYDNLVLTRGKTTDRDMWDWVKDVARMSAQVGQVHPNYKKNLAIVQYDRARNEVDRWNVHDAFPVAYEGSNWDNTVDEANVETLELKYSYFDHPGD